MASSSAEFHESEERLRPETMEYHRAIVSLMEELEAVDWYNQRIDGSEDPELRRILAHNRDEEKEHAAMALEWLRRRDPELDRFLREYLFTEGSIVAIEEARELHQPHSEADAVEAGAIEGGDSGAAGNGASLGIGSLRGRSSR
jgi:ferritin-like protein